MIPEFPMMSPNDLYNKKGSFDNVTDEETLAVARYHAKQYNSPQGGMIYNVETGVIDEVSDRCSEIQYVHKCRISQALSMGITSMMGFKILWTYEDYETMVEMKDEQDDVAEVVTEETEEQNDEEPKEEEPETQNENEPAYYYAVWQRGVTVYGVGETPDDAIEDVREWVSDYDQMLRDLDEGNDSKIIGKMELIKISPAAKQEIGLVGGDVDLEEDDAGIYRIDDC